MIPLSSRLVALALAALLLAGCGQAAPAAAPAKKADFPQKGKAISISVGYAPGSASDIAARVLAPQLEKELGVPVEVVNKEGAGSQVQLTELAQAKPDGHTLGYAQMPTAPLVYLNPERKAVFSRKDFQTIALQTQDSHVVAVLTNSPFKTLKDMVDAAKANPGKVKVGTGAILGDGHMATLMLEKAAGVKFGVVNMEGGSTVVTGVLGRQVDAGIQSTGTWTPQVKGGEIRLLGIMSDQESKFAPGVKTMESQGYKAYAGVARGLVAPAKTPKEVIDILSAAVKKGVDSEEHLKRLGDAGINVRYMDAEQFGKYWDGLEADLKPVVAEILSQQKQTK